MSERVIVYGMQLFIYWIISKKAPYLANPLFWVAYSVMPLLIATSSKDQHFVLNGWSITIPILSLFFTNNIAYFLSNIAANLYIISQSKSYIQKGYEFLDTEQGSSFVVLEQYLNLIFVSIVAFQFYNKIQQKEKVSRECKQAAEVAAQNLKHFIESFSHELRNPMNSLVGNLDLALKEAHITPQIKQYLETSKSCTTILLQLINNILDTGKYDIGALEINKKPTRLKTTIQEVWQAYSNQFKAQEIEGMVIVDKKVPPVLNIDGTRMVQILMNMLSNALKFTTSGSVRAKFDWIDNQKLVKNGDFIVPNLRNQSNFDQQNVDYLNLNKRAFDENEQENPRASIHLSQDGILRIVIEDTGEGISEQDLGKLFQKFHQFSSDVERRKKGTGLGMNITKQIIALSGGDVKVFSQLGVGTQFVICLPTRGMFEEPKSQLSESEKKQLVEDLTNKKLRFHIVGIEKYHVKLLTSYIQMIEGAVEAFYPNGEQCYRKLKHSDTMGDVLFVSDELPLMEASKLIEKLKALKKGNDSPTKFISYSKICLNDFSDKDCFDSILKVPATFEDFLTCLR